MALVLVTLLYYTDIATFLISSVQHKEEITVFYEDGTEPKDKIADISIAALDSMVASRLGDKQYRFVSLDMRELGDLSDGEVQYLLTYFTKYSDRVILASLENLMRIGLCTPLTKDLHGGILLSIDGVIEMTDESVIMKISAHESGLGAAGYICKLIYKDGKWQVDELELKYMA
jgi:hypothetical protein